MFLGEGKACIPHAGYTRAHISNSYSNWLDIDLRRQAMSLRWIHEEIVDVLRGGGTSKLENLQSHHKATQWSGRRQQREQKGKGRNSLSPQHYSTCKRGNAILGAEKQLCDVL